MNGPTIEHSAKSAAIRGSRQINFPLRGIPLVSADSGATFDEVSLRLGSNEPIPPFVQADVAPRAPREISNNLIV
jgi:hypothetical protein